jgi:cobalt-zinc-cadmium efflux system outer membrane protein
MLARALSTFRVVSFLTLTLMTACASTGATSYDTLRADVDRTRVKDDRSRAEDDQALRAPTLDRAAFVRAVLHRNPSIEAARAGWRAAVAHVRSSGTFDDPMVSVAIAPLSITASDVPFGWQGMISQTLPWPGKLSLDESIAKAEAAAAKSDFEATRRELALSAAMLYDEYFVLARSLEINAQHQALLRELKASAVAQFETGRGSAQDSLQAETELTHLEHYAVVLGSDREVAVAQMNELLHRDPSSPMPPPAADLALPPAPDHDARALGDKAVEARPEIRAARDHARAESARAERAERDWYPDLTVSTSYSSMWPMTAMRWMVGLGFNLPIQGGRRAGAREAAEAARSRFEEQATALGDKARTEVAVATTRLHEAHHVARLYAERLIPIARDTVDAARAGFITSRNDFVAVIAAERNLRDVELGYQMARADIDRREALLDRAIGRIPGLDPANAGGEEVGR